MRVIFCLLIALSTCSVKGYSRQKRQFSLGFGLPSSQDVSIGFGLPSSNPNSGGGQGQNLGSVINGFLGGLFGQGQNQNQQGQLVTINPNDFLNQFAGGFSQSCTVQNGGCEQGCRQRGRRIQCYCNQGYILQNNQKSCLDINECIIPGNQPCQGICTNTVGSYKCSCTNGLVLLPDGRSCGQYTATCQKDNGGCPQKCLEANGRVTCGCIEGFALGEDQRNCFDVNECASGNPCGAGQVCKNNLGSYQCERESIPTCAVNKGGCQQKCEDTPNGPKCGCRNNFILNPDLISCKRINNQNGCDADNGGCEQICRFRRGKVRCRCNEGFQLRDDKKTCEAHLGCQVDNGGCEHNCRTNNKGRIRCSCNQGFKLDSNKKSCISENPPTPTDPCLVGNGGCDQICVNNNGVPRCHCRQGFIFVNGVCKRSSTTIFFPGQLPSPTPIIPPITPPTKPPPTQECGVNTKKSTFRTRIVGGQPADPKDWPWMAALLRRLRKEQFCGGTLISDRHVLTAAHCVYGLKPSDLYVRLGEYDFKTADENNPTDFRVDEIRSHANYNTQTQENDISILKMGRSSSFSEFIWPACLPPPDKNFENEKGYVTGWGTIDFGGPVSTLLLEVVLPVWTQQDCVNAYPQNVIANTMMCAGLRSGGKDSCQGDSGGPFLVQILPSSRWYVAGVVSWGKECARPENPGVYTRVNKYLDWIKQNTVD